MTTMHFTKRINEGRTMRLYRRGYVAVTTLRGIAARWYFFAGRDMQGTLYSCLQGYKLHQGRSCSLRTAKVVRFLLQARWQEQGQRVKRAYRCQAVVGS